MNSRTVIARLLPTIFAWSACSHAESPTGTSGAADTFDLAERKQKQPWIWATPGRQAIPAAKNNSWPLSPEDNFILHRLEAEGLDPAPEASGPTWLRRVHFVITGLPPRRDEIQAFLADTRPGARERVVDRLLASPAFGERWARHWMDLMRYAESRGHEGDYIIANAWHYRDYLIRAFNADVPYNQFLFEHLAGDLAPEPRLRPGTEINESVVATGWAFLGEENHSPVDIRQDECERIDNKVDVFSKAFLGLTVSCARCHDHKFDPIRAQDYYALTGFILGSHYRQVRFEAMENNRRMAGELAALRERSSHRLASLVLKSRQESIPGIAAYLQAAFEVLLAEKSGPVSLAPIVGRESLDSVRFGLWVEHLRQAATNQANPLHPFARAAQGRDAEVGEYFHKFIAEGHLEKEVGLPAGFRVIADYSTPGLQPWKADGEGFGNRSLVPGEVILGKDASNPIERVMSYGAARRDLFWNRLRMSPGNENDSGKLAATTRAGQMLATPTVTLGVGKLHYLIRGRALVYAAVDSHLMVEGPLHGQLVQKFDSGTGNSPRWVTHDLTPYSGHRVHVEFGPDGDGELEVLKVIEASQTPVWHPRAQWLVPSRSVNSYSEFAKEFERAVAEAASGFLEHAMETVVDASLVNWLVQNFALFSNVPDPKVVTAAKEFLEAEDEIARRTQWESATAVSWFDGTGVDENVLLRGKPFKPGALSPRGLPAAIANGETITTLESSGRLELAREMIEPSNPLVARVLVNRVWHHVFGRGIVASVDNFGALGERATHPELLDHLAWEFSHRDNWSIKCLIRRLVLTRTFAMSSVSTDPRARERDPANLLLHRMPIRRLEGEAIRDALLAVSGRLDSSVGGPPVTVHLTEFLVGRGRPEPGGPLDGSGRRSIYTAMRRNFISTLMQTFDLPTPFSTVGKRNVTNVPAQSLALMNDPLFRQQARVWADRLVRETGGASNEFRVQCLFESAYGRKPEAEEAIACLEALDEFRQLHPSKNHDCVEPWSDLCHALLNANDFIYVK